MGKFTDSILDGVDSFLAWISGSLKQTTESYCELETADKDALIAHDGSRISIARLHGAKALVGAPEFLNICEGFSRSLQASLVQPGHVIQVFFSHTRETMPELIKSIYEPAKFTAKRLQLSLEDLFAERSKVLSRYCAEEQVYLVFWTRPFSLSNEQLKNG